MFSQGDDAGTKEQLEACEASRELGSDLAHYCFFVILLTRSSPRVKVLEVEWESFSRIEGMDT